MEDEEIIDRVELANKMLFKYDKWLLEHNLSEQCITHKLATYLQDVFSDYDVDCEYNGNIDNPDEKKKISIVKHDLRKKGLLTEKEEGENDKELAERRVFPDIIIHERGNNESNLGIIEVKKSNSSISPEYDDMKLKSYTSGSFGNNLKYQLGIFILLIIDEEKPELISFRKLVPEINNTGYLTHSTHYYPAKFIPQVVRYYIEHFTQPKDLIIDPFAGCGTVGLESYICNRNSFLMDINPIINHIMPVKLYDGKEKLKEKKLIDCIKQFQQSTDIFIPNWKTIDTWYPTEIYEVLTNYWGGQKLLEKNIYSLIVESALLRVSKQFSYAEHKVPKLFRSKRKRQAIKKLLTTNWKRKLNDEISDLALSTLLDVNELIKLTKNNECYVTIKGGVDSSTFDYTQTPKFDGLVTSPPYLQAQEYIRTSKLDLFWLGYSEDNIKKLSKLEIPYRKPSRILDTKTLNDVKSKIARTDLIKLTDSYFSLTIDTLERAMNNMKSGSTACIFIGNPTVDGNIVEIWRVFKEYFIENGFTFEGIYEDRIKNRQLFSGRNNKNPSGMKSEYLLMLKKK